MPDVCPIPDCVVYLLYIFNGYYIFPFNAWIIKDNTSHTPALLLIVQYIGRFFFIGYC